VATRPVDPVKAAAEKAKNDEKQFDYFKRRAEEGSDHAQYELGIRYLAGRGTAPDEKLGREWLAKAAKNGNSQAAKKLAELGVEPAEASAPEKPAIQKIEPAPASKQESKPAEPAKSSSAK
jgi:TPR repeat protein